MAQITTYDPSKAREYRKLSKELGDYQQEVSDRFKECQETGDLATAKEILKEATLKTQPFIELQRELGATGVFLAKYGVEVINDHTILFVIPKGATRISILEEAHALIQEREGRDLIDKDFIPMWQTDERFTKQQESSKRLCIDGHVEGGDAKTREQQESFLGDAFTMPQFEDLAVAFSLHWVATGEPLFGWFNKQEEWSFVIRGVGGALYFHRNVLRASTVHGVSVSNNVGVSALVSPE